MKYLNYAVFSDFSLKVRKRVKHFISYDLDLMRTVVREKLAQGVSKGELFADMFANFDYFVISVRFDRECPYSPLCRDTTERANQR